VNAGDATLALVWGLVAGGALIIGAALAWFARPSQRVVAAVMAFGAGILISVIAFDLMEEAFEKGGLVPTGFGFLVGAGIFTAGSVLLARAGARHRMRSTMMPDHRDDAAFAIALGTFIDGIPEALVIGLSLIDGTGVALATVIAIFLSNIPEALSSSAGMKAAGRSAGYVFGLWGAIMLVSGVASLVGYAAFAELPPEIVAVTQSIAAGALLALIADTMIPEAFAETHDAAGLIAALGFLSGFALSHGLH
jgi:ZIP family zinc transporter